MLIYGNSKGNVYIMSSFLEADPIYRPIYMYVCVCVCVKKCDMCCMVTAFFYSFIPKAYPTHYCEIVTQLNAPVRCSSSIHRGGRVVRKCWVNFQCWGVLLIWTVVGQGPTTLAVGADGGCLDIFSLIYHFSFLSPSLWEAARYRLKYCLKGPLSPKQPTNQILHTRLFPCIHNKQPDPRLSCRHSLTRFLLKCLAVYK